MFGYYSTTSDNLDEIRERGIRSIPVTWFGGSYRPECVFYTEDESRAGQYAEFLADTFATDFGKAVEPVVLRFVVREDMRTENVKADGFMPDRMIVPSRHHVHLLPEELEIKRDGSWSPLLSGVEEYGAQPMFQPTRVKERICDFCRNFEKTDRHCKKLDIWDVPAAKAKDCFFFDYKPIPAGKTPTGRPKPPGSWFYANAARFGVKNYKEGRRSSVGSICGSIWWHKLSDDRIAEKIGLWGTEDEIESARMAGWEIRDYDVEQRQREQDRIKEEIDDDLSGLDPNWEPRLYDDIRKNYRKVWKDEEEKSAEDVRSPLDWLTR